ncbi:short-chain dehydrogenase [Shouchella clausii]|nr:short-chain dehydrogenase [Shouchella clausii]
MRLANKVALITGAGSGIGKETAALFAKEGAFVTINDIDETKGKAAAKAICAAGGNVSFIQADTTNAADVETMVTDVVREYGRIDVLFNNAGVSGIGPLHEIEEDAWDRVVNVNLKGVFLPSKYVLPHMIAARSGTILNMSSCIAEIGLANRAAYAATKGAVLSLTKSMQVDYAAYNIRINALLPGTIFTPFVEAYLAESDDPEKTIAAIKKRQLSGELGLPEDVAKAALFLASDESRFVMGAPLYIDGGVVFGKNA